MRSWPRRSYQTSRKAMKRRACRKRRCSSGCKNVAAGNGGARWCLGLGMGRRGRRKAASRGGGGARLVVHVGRELRHVADGHGVVAARECQVVRSAQRRAAQRLKGDEARAARGVLERQPPPASQRHPRPRQATALAKRCGRRVHAVAQRGGGGGRGRVVEASLDGSRPRDAALAIVAVLRGELVHADAVFIERFAEGGDVDVPVQPALVEVLRCAV